ncbi:MAG: glycosyltransferase [Actinomycetota bacterium]|nr:glycosyltransferase [Actinomycetota bacterium]
MHTRPLGLVELSIPDAGLSPASLGRALWAALAHDVCAHLRSDGLPTVAGIAEGGIAAAAAAAPPCLAPRQRSVERAVPASVIVATRNRPETLLACLSSLSALEHPPFEIIVVDNAPSSDATREVVEAFRRADRPAPVARYLRTERPGLAAAHNTGLGVARGDIVAFTDDDVLVDPYWLAELGAGFDIAPDVGCVTGLILPAELDTVAQVRAEQRWGFGKGFVRRVYDLGPHRPSDQLFPYTAGSFGSGANMAFRREVLENVGGFDPVMGTGTPARGGDDLLAFFTIITQGWKLVYEPAAIVHHRNHRTVAALRRQAFGYGAGLTAFLARVLAREPGRLREVVPRVPGGAAHLARARGRPCRGDAVGRDWLLGGIEALGALWGPVGLALSLRDHNRASGG